uniref:Uncharacterized protein n=1 Tax=Anguilla anguilla TaxID=7936 RepID=A0A0E9Y011_ANGAN
MYYSSKCTLLLSTPGSRYWESLNKLSPPVRYKSRGASLVLMFSFLNQKQHHTPINMKAVVSLLLIGCLGKVFNLRFTNTVSPSVSAAIK